MNNDIFLARTTDRKEWYRRQIDHHVRQIPSMQTSDGAFRLNIESRFNPNANARLQEGVLPLAWHVHRFGTNHFCDPIIRGLNYLFPLQLPNGAYPETTGESFAATAFITFALARTLDYGREFLPDSVKHAALRSIQRALPLLIADRPVLYTNQHAAALLALKESGKLFTLSDHTIDWQLKSVLSTKDSSGLFQEDAGIDLGYSTLTYSLLSSFDSSRDFYHEFINCLRHMVFPDGTHILPMSRTHGWIILNALEAAARFYPAAQEFAQQSINAHESGLTNATHLVSNRHILTTLYRLCEAYDNCCRRSLVPDFPTLSQNPPLRSRYLRYYSNGQSRALLYLGDTHLGYSFYLGPNRILFGHARDSMAIEKGRTLVILERERGKLFRGKRSFEFCHNSVVLRNRFAHEPIFSVGNLFRGHRHPRFWDANENMFYRDNIFVRHPSKLYRRRLQCIGG